MTTLATFLVLMTPTLTSGPESDDPMRATHWLSAELGHLSRTLPAVTRAVETPLNPAVRVAYHRRLVGRGAFSGGFSLQGGFEGFDQLFWSLSSGGGLEGVYRGSSGLFSAVALRLDYARAFTGNNHFVAANGRYVQKTDPGRGFLRMTLADVTLGYSPSVLRRRGVVPAFHYGWMLETPLYANDGANPWSYTTFGVSVLWMLGRAP